MIGTQFNKENLDLNAYSQAASWCNVNRAVIEDKGEYYEVVPIPDLTLDEIKQEKLKQLGSAFAVKRDAIRWVDVSGGHYGFDCANDDITNFMASWKAAELAGSTLYKVWTSESEKGMVTLTTEDFTAVFNAVRQSQYEAYAWYGTKKAEIENAATVEEINAVGLE